MKKFLDIKNNESMVKYIVYYFRDIKNTLFLKNNDTKLSDEKSSYNSEDLTKIYNIVQKFYSETDLSLTNNNLGTKFYDSKVVGTLITEYYEFFKYKISVDLVQFMRAPFGFWQSVKNYKSENHEFVDDSYEILIKNIDFELFNIYRKEEKEKYKYIAVDKGLKLKKCFEWENGVIIHCGGKIGENVRVGEDTIIDSAVKISNNVRIGKKCTILSFVEISENSIIDDFMTIASDTWV